MTWDNKDLPAMIERDKLLRQYGHKPFPHGNFPIGDNPHEKASYHYDPATMSHKVRVQNGDESMEGKIDDGKGMTPAQMRAAIMELMVQLLMVLRERMKQREEQRKKDKEREQEKKEEEKKPNREERRKQLQGEPDWVKKLRQDLTGIFKAHGVGAS